MTHTHTHTHIRGSALTSLSSAVNGDAISIPRQANQVSLIAPRAISSPTSINQKRPDRKGKEERNWDLDIHFTRLESLALRRLMDYEAVTSVEKRNNAMSRIFNSITQQSVRPLRCHRRREIAYIQSRAWDGIVARNYHLSLTVCQSAVK